LKNLLGKTDYSGQGYRMPKCPSCGREVEKEDEFCKFCGAGLVGLADNQTKAASSLENDVKSTVVSRLDGIKNRDEDRIRAIIDERYSKFDDWPPYGRQEATEALENEFGAFKVLSNYTYEVKNFEANVLGDTAVATFHLHYQGVIRNRPFEINSRVTSVLRKQDSGWKVVHEHFSRFPEETGQQIPGSPSPQSTPGPSPPPHPLGRDKTRTYVILGLISAVIGLLILPEIFDSVAIVLGAYTWRRRQGNLGLIVLIIGIICMIAGIEVVPYLLAS
jgi:ketosteroid isomerase-like protein